ncbi:complement factor B-like [Colius striatus]|uniref:complement factor B-like n=1 Tax=Colius striatus TaxID=57412 RepID=UPI002B1D87D0|nr:complement factor B-like [Colius striatus]
MAAALFRLLFLLSPSQGPGLGRDRGWVGGAAGGGGGASLSLPPREQPPPHLLPSLRPRWPLGPPARGGPPPLPRRVVPSPPGVRARLVLAPGGGDTPPGSQLEFGCFGGFTLRGPQKLVCGAGGRWEGATPVCDDGAGDCPAPGVPPGATKEGSHYGVEGRIRYRCRAGLSLVGSAERRCLEGGTWSGTEPRCRDPNSFDPPEAAAASFLASLAQTVEVAESNNTRAPTEKRRIRLGPGAALNIFLVLDASQSVSPDDFSGATGALGQLVEKCPWEPPPSSPQHPPTILTSPHNPSPTTPNTPETPPPDCQLRDLPHYGIVTFGTEARVVLSPTEPRASDGTWVQQLLEGLSNKAHAQKPGTNPQAALRAVYGLLVQQELEEQQRGLRPPPVTNSTRHVIVIVTDGRVNMGGSPVPVIHQIRELLSIGRDPRDDREDFLDVYVFGVGAEVHVETLNALASHKDGEQHVFLLRGPLDLQETFHHMIDESETLGLCGISRDFGSASDRERNPWHSTVTITRPGRGVERCQASLLSPHFLLTAAHCFGPEDLPQWVTVAVGPGVQRPVSRLHTHPGFQLGGRKHRGVPEFYDYDVALLELDRAVRPSPTHRPLCIPCTQSAAQALRLPPESSSCQEHRRLLLPEKTLEAFFVSPRGPNELLRQRVHIKLGGQRGPCEADALRAPLYANVSALDDVVTPRFLCSGGTEPEVDPNACRGDSGGPLIVTRGKRHFQVGVVSWGVLDVCRQPRAPPYARDFHVGLFEVLPWLRQQLHEDVAFLPDTP